MANAFITDPSLGEIQLVICRPNNKANLMLSNQVGLKFITGFMGFQERRVRGIGEPEYHRMSRYLVSLKDASGA
ncbi:hypothetical protein Ciccas_013265 [Cichlidogyrus casuarinus]|uniref:Ribosomal protein L5 n=1 Tax=Cichlidogyrus casuarinus TaxID=1844966 RepID=A0ABD2PL10_9PLAT